MVDKERWGVIRNLLNQGVSITDIAKETGNDRKTVAKYIKQEQYKKYDREYKSMIDGFKDYINLRLEQHNISALKLFKEIKKQDFDGKYGIVAKYVAKIKKSLKKKARLRFETMPGEQAQVDWGYCGEIYDNELKKKVKLNCFVMILGYSRMKYVEFFTDQKMQSFLEGHNNAFKYFNGYTKEILYDNLKSVVIKRMLRAKDSKYNEQFMDFAGYYGFKPILARPYSPETKGKVESLVKYVKNNFYAGETFQSINEVNQRAKQWLEEVNNLVHYTTKEIPYKRIKREGLLTIENKKMFDLTKTELRKVYNDCHFTFDKKFYSVPFKYVGKEVTVKKNENNEIEVRYKNELITKHNLNEQGFYITKKEHREELEKIRMSNSQRSKSNKEKAKEDFELIQTTSYKANEKIIINDLSIYEEGIYE